MIPLQILFTHFLEIILQYTYMCLHRTFLHILNAYFLKEAFLLYDGFVVQQDMDEDNDFQSF